MQSQGSKETTMDGERYSLLFGSCRNASSYCPSKERFLDTHKVGDSAHVRGQVLPDSQILVPVDIRQLRLDINWSDLGTRLALAQTLHRENKLS